MSFKYEPSSEPLPSSSSPRRDWYSFNNPTFRVPAFLALSDLGVRLVCRVNLLGGRELRVEGVGLSALSVGLRVESRRMRVEG